MSRTDTAPPRLVLNRLLGHRPAGLSLLLLLVFGLSCALAPWIAPYEFDEIDLASIRQAPSWEHWMGTDDLGRDLFTRMLYGGRISLLIGVLAAFLSTLIGTAVGALAGFFGGWLDNVLMRITDTAYAIPALPLLIVLSAYSQAAVPAMVVIVSLLSWMAPARVVRSRGLSIREMEYVIAARAIGASSWRILLRHVIPNTVGPIVVGATLAVGNAIMIESALSFLGLGVQPPVPTWGNLLQDAQSTMVTKPWLAVFPGVAILLTVLSINFIGDGLRDATELAESR